MSHCKLNNNKYFVYTRNVLKSNRQIYDHEEIKYNFSKEISTFMENELITKSIISNMKLHY